MAPAPIPFHQQVRVTIVTLLNSFVRHKKLGRVLDSPIDVLFSKTDVVQPDIVFISKSNLNIVEEKYIHGAPDLVVEVLSPGTQKKDRTIKHKLYEKHGVQEYWIVSPEGRSVDQYILQDGSMILQTVFTVQDTLTSTRFPGFELALHEVFEDINDLD